jgi:hypothetical protein
MVCGVKDDMAVESMVEIDAWYEATLKLIVGCQGLEVRRSWSRSGVY